MNSPKLFVKLSVVVSAFLFLALSVNVFGSVPVGYTYNNMTVIPEGNWTQIGFGNSFQSVEWKILDVSSGRYIVTHQESTERIQSPCQNSVIDLFEGKGVKGAEVYSFTKQGVEASIVIKNTGDTRLILAPIFVMKSGPHYELSLGSTGSLNSEREVFSQKSSVYEISPNVFELTQGNVNVNWVSDLSLFHSGAVIHTLSSNVISIPFGPIVLLKSETYTEDPIIRPSIVKVCACTGGGGGGGGTSEPPIIGYFRVVNSYNSTFENGTQNFDLDYSLISMGTYSSVKIGFFLEDPSGAYYQIGSTTVYSTGSYSFSVKPNYVGQWEQFAIAVYYSGWDIQLVAGHSFIAFENTNCGYVYPNSGYVGGGDNKILNSTGHVVGAIFGDIQSPNKLQPGFSLEYQIISGVATRNNDYRVNSVGMYLNYTDNSLNQTASFMKSKNGVQQYVYFSSYQNYQNSSAWPLIDEILWTAAFSVASAVTDGAPSALFAAGGALNPFLFLGENTQNPPSTPPQNFTYTQNAGWGVIPGCGWGDYFYNALGTKYDQTLLSYKFKPSYMFDTGDKIDIQAADNYATTKYVVDYFQYTMVYSIFNNSKDMCYDTFPNLYSGSYTVSVYLPEEVTSG